MLIVVSPFVKILTGRWQPVQNSAHRKNMFVVVLIAIVFIVVVFIVIIIILIVVVVVVVVKQPRPGIQSSPSSEAVELT